jgi:DNA-binding MarR family transcriptional regulator
MNAKPDSQSAKNTDGRVDVRVDAQADATAPGAAGQPAPADPKRVPADFYKPEAYALMNSVGHMMRKIVGTVSQEAERQLEPVGLTHAQWVPLYKLALGHASTVAELARGCQLDAGGMTRLLDRMEAKGLCRRVRSSEDRRVVNIELTPEGFEAAKHIPVVLSGIQNAFLAGFSEEEWKTLTGFLTRILDNAEAFTASEKQP